MADQGRMVKGWLTKAAVDLRTTKLLLAQNSDDFFGACVFHAQQAAEKAIKGYLAFNKVRFPKSHDIEKLLELVSSVDHDLALELKPSTILTKFAAAYRYPEEVELQEPLTAKTCENAHVLANWVFEEMKSRTTD